MEKKFSPWFIYQITAVAAIGGLLFGYDTAVIAGAIGFLQVKFHLSAAMTGWVASCAILGCLVSSMFAGHLSDRIGRKKMLILSALLFALSSLGILLSNSIIAFVAYRIAGGMGIGIASILAPLYIAEISPAAIRGKLVSVNQLGIVLGILLIYFVNAGIAGLYTQTWNVNVGWKYMFGSGIVPSGLFLIMLFYVPESPRWLSEHGSTEASLAVLTRINGREAALAEQENIRQTIGEKQTGAVSELFKPGLRKAMITGVLLAVFSQVTGINAIMYYAPEIFKSAGNSSDTALLQTILVGIVNLFFTLVAIRYVDRAGRKQLLLIGSGGMAVCLAITGFAFNNHALPGWLILTAILIYIAFFAFSLGPLTFVVIAEIFPNKVRGIAMSICIFFLWAAVFLVSQTFPILLQAVGAACTFWIFMCMAILAFIFIWTSVRETKGLKLEDAASLWGHKDSPGV